MRKSPGSAYAQMSDDALLRALQADGFKYFSDAAQRTPNSLFPDNTLKDSPCSIAAVGYALSSYAVAAARGLVARGEAIGVVLATLRFFAKSEQSDRPDATGYRGFYYHFLDSKTGRRTWKCELSSIDTALLIAGALTAARGFDRDSADEREIRDLADTLYRRVEWDWMCSGEPSVTLGWRPERGFLPYRWLGYSEGLLIYLLALGSPTHPITPEGYAAWTSTYHWQRLYGYDYLYAGPLFIHQMVHGFVDLRGIRDAFMRAHNCDYFENSRRATLIQREYAIRNPRDFFGYGENCWGITASDGPGPARRSVKGRERVFYSYEARGVPFGPDDGTIAPWAAIASLPFAPKEVLAAIHSFARQHVGDTCPYGFEATINPSFLEADGKTTWKSTENYGLNQGPIVLMIENYRTGMVWEWMRGCPYLVAGLQRAGFEGGWLSSAHLSK